MQTPNLIVTGHAPAHCSYSGSNDLYSSIGCSIAKDLNLIVTEIDPGFNATLCGVQSSGLVLLARGGFMMRILCLEHRDNFHLPVLRQMEPFTLT
jgi:hypothetical protein